MKDKVCDRRESHFLLFRFPIRNQSVHNFLQTSEETLVKLKNTSFNFRFLYKENTNKIEKNRFISNLKTINNEKNMSTLKLSVIFINIFKYLFKKCVKFALIYYYPPVQYLNFVQISDKDSSVEFRSFFLIRISKMND